MGKTFKDFNPYKKIRIPVPRPGHRMKSKKDYDRSRIRQSKDLEEEEGYSDDE